KGCPEVALLAAVALLRIEHADVARNASGLDRARKTRRAGREPAVALAIRDRSIGAPENALLIRGAGVRRERRALLVARRDRRPGELDDAHLIHRARFLALRTALIRHARARLRIAHLLHRIGAVVGGLALDGSGVGVGLRVG